MENAVGALQPDDSHEQRRRVKVAHPNLYTFLGHLQRTTTDCETDIT